MCALALVTLSANAESVTKCNVPPSRVPEPSFSWLRTGAADALLAEGVWPNRAIKKSARTRFFCRLHKKNQKKKLNSVITYVYVCNFKNIKLPYKPGLERWSLYKSIWIKHWKEFQKIYQEKYETTYGLLI